MKIFGFLSSEKVKPGGLPLTFFRKKGEGFTLIEMLVYVAVLVIVFSAVVYFFLWTTRSQTKAKVIHEVLNNARRAIEIMNSEIKEAKNIYTPSSIFDSHPGQLTLQTTKHLPAGENTSYVDFYLCDDRLCLKKESQPPVALTSDKVKVTNLLFNQIASTSPAIQIDLKIEFKDSTGRPERQTAIETTSLSSLRSY